MNPNVLHLATGMVSCALSINIHPTEETQIQAQELVTESFAAADTMLTHVEIQDMIVLLSSMIAGILCADHEDPAHEWLSIVEDLFIEFGHEEQAPNFTDINLN